MKNVAEYTSTYYQNGVNNSIHRFIADSDDDVYTCIVEHVTNTLNDSNVTAVIQSRDVYYIRERPTEMRGFTDYEAAKQWCTDMLEAYDTSKEPSWGKSL